MRHLKACVLHLLLCLWLVLSGAGLPNPALAQEAGQDASIAQVDAGSGEIDFPAWEALAARAESALAQASVETPTLNQLRAELVDWRADLQRAQSTNSARIDTLKTQITALGPVPAEGETEAEEIATRRKQLNDQLSVLQAPSIAAEEAYSRADGLIREIDRIIRERQADELLRLQPSPLNPANWFPAYDAVAKIAAALVFEATARWKVPAAREELLDNLPAILLLFLVAVAAISRGWALVEAIIGRLLQRSTRRGMRISALAISLGQIILPMIGVVALSIGLQLSGLLGRLGIELTVALPAAGFSFFLAFWLGGRLFPRSDDILPLPFTADRRAEGRMLSTVYGLLSALQVIRTALFEDQDISEAAQSVIEFPFLLVASFVLWRVGGLLRAHVTEHGNSDDERGFQNRIIGFLARGARIVSVVGPLLGAIGYLPAATAIVYPAAFSLVLIGILFVLQIFVHDLYALFSRNDEDVDHALVPVLAGFLLVVAALPIFALIWGARPEDLAEIWNRLRDGFQIGETRISPTIFLVFATVFAVGFAATRIFQGALKTTILPRTRMDQGARNAITSGAGYVGIFLAGLIAINTAGLDLSGLAIVAGGLSLGIGFGLQNIVSNFVSGIILLIERPVSEGDWIEVGGVQGIVKSISVRSTRIQTFDRTDVIVPNTDLVAGRVTNWTRFNLSGRLIVPVGVAYGSDTRKVEAILKEIAEAQPMAILTPPPLVVFQGFGADSMNFEIRIILRDVNFSLSVRSELNHEIARRFAEEGVEIPFAQRDINLRNVEEIARALHRDPQSSGMGPASMGPSASMAEGQLASRTDKGDKS